MVIYLYVKVILDNLYWRACIKSENWVVIYLYVKVIIDNLYWRACIKSENWVVIYLYVKDIVVASFHDFATEIGNFLYNVNTLLRYFSCKDLLWEVIARFVDIDVNSVFHK